MPIDALMNDAAVLAELGRRIALRRIDHQLTQAALAHEAGVSKRTVERVEAGASAQMVSLIRICRVLDLLAGLDQWIAPAGPRPMDLIATKGQPRRRASTRRKTPKESPTWSWDK
ncbi:MAG: helix-turn-helix domain-containing protein [Desulfobacteraceae bacterium]|nr:helix-turn-helix domain-containing protein [Desulfobacteraceae bacterium]